MDLKKGRSGPTGSVGQNTKPAATSNLRTSGHVAPPKSSKKSLKPLTTATPTTSMQPTKSKKRKLHESPIIVDSSTSRRTTKSKSRTSEVGGDKLIDPPTKLIDSPMNSTKGKDGGKEASKRMRESETKSDFVEEEQLVWYTKERRTKLANEKKDKQMRLDNPKPDKQLQIGKDNPMPDVPIQKPMQDKHDMSLLPERLYESGRYLPKGRINSWSRCPSPGRSEANTGWE